MPTYFLRELGTSIVWGEASGVGVTNAFSLDALADGAGRMGPFVDLGVSWADEHVLELRIETGTAPSAGKTTELYLAFSVDSSNWPGKVTGSDAAYPATVADNKKLLGVPACVLCATADGTTILRQAPVLIRPRGRYVAPVLINVLGVAFRDEATNSNNDSRVILTPLRSLV
jgi:hypothetical protein